MDKKRKKEAKPGWPASQPAQDGLQAGLHPETAGLPAGPDVGLGPIFTDLRGKGMNATNTKNTEG